MSMNLKLETAAYLAASDKAAHVAELKKQFNRIQLELIAGSLVNTISGVAKGPRYGGGDWRSGYGMAEMFGVGVTAVSDAKRALEIAAPFEIAEMMAGRLAPSTFRKVMRKGLTEAQRIERWKLPKSKRYDPGKYDRQRDEAALWGKLRVGIEAIATLPSAADMMLIAAKYEPRFKFLASKLAIATQWLEDFNNVVSAKKHDEDSHHAANGGQDAGSQQAQPPSEAGPCESDRGRNQTRPVAS